MSEPRYWHIEKRTGPHPDDHHVCIRGPDTVGEHDQLQRLKVVDIRDYNALKSQLAEVTKEKFAAIDLVNTYMAALAETCESMQKRHAAADERTIWALKERDEAKAELVTLKAAHAAIHTALYKERTKSAKLAEALKLMTEGDKDGDFCTYYERHLPGKTIPTFAEIAEKALAEYEGQK